MAEKKNYNYPLTMISVHNLSEEMTNDELKSHMSQFGDVKSALILKDFNTGKSRGFGFVTFEHAGDAQDLLENQPKALIGGKWIDIRKPEEANVKK